MQRGENEAFRANNHGPLLCDVLHIGNIRMNRPIEKERAKTCIFISFLRTKNMLSYRRETALQCAL